MNRILTIAVTVSVVILLSIFAGFLWLSHEMTTPNGITEERYIIIEKGSTGRALAQQLAQQKIISHADLFYLLLRLQPATIQAGEYKMAPHATMKDILAQLRIGKIVRRYFTLAEGLTVKQAEILLQQNEFLTGDIPSLPPEGSLLPDTYDFTRGTARTDLIKRMQQAQTEYLDTLWQKRGNDFPLQTKEQVIILASIIEKETGQASERTRIAGLFFNRLKIGMPLQTDPTIVYAVTNGLGHMGGNRLYKKHLAIDSPYNTYKNVGLTPTPIANPGRASIAAVFEPEKNDYLFFVADGTGGHTFSKTLTEHNKAVAIWRKVRDQK